MAKNDHDPLLDSLRNRPVPAWFDAAKFGIFVHWGLFSVPAFAAPTHDSIVDILRTDYYGAQARNPYAEWYYNTLRVPGSVTAAHHKATYGDRPYDAFKDDFENDLSGFDAAAWARAFKQAGAEYFVLVTKHHDGYLLWPSAHENPHKPDWQSKRDLVGELADAVRAEGMRFGVYYSGGIDWTFRPGPICTGADMLNCMPTEPEYIDYAEAHVKELIDRYRPSILWNDIGWPSDQARLNKLFDYYYSQVPEGVVNDRWSTPSGLHKISGNRVARWFIDKMAARAMRSLESMTPPKPPHFDFRTPEYSTLKEAGDDKWEATRGIGHSFGYNAAEDDSHLIAVEELISGFTDMITHGGNLLLNLGPHGNGALDPKQLDRLQGFGDWLNAHAEAVFDTTPVAGAALPTMQSPEGVSYVFLIEPNEGDAVNVNAPSVELLGYGALEVAEGKVTLPDAACHWPVAVLKLG